MGAKGQGRCRKIYWPADGSIAALLHTCTRGRVRAGAAETEASFLVFHEVEGQGEGRKEGGGMGRNRLVSHGTFCLVVIFPHHCRRRCRRHSRSRCRFLGTKRRERNGRTKTRNRTSTKSS